MNFKKKGPQTSALNDKNKQLFNISIKMYMELLSCPDGCEPCFYFPFTHPRPHSPAGLLGVHSDADGYTQMVDPVMHPVYKKTFSIMYYILGFF